MRLVSSTRAIRLLVGLMLISAVAVPGFAAARRNLAGFSTNTLPRNDDSSTSAVNIGFPINFFGTTYNTLYVNNNGNLTFTGRLGTYIPFELLSTSTPIMAAYFGDVDTSASASGVVTYGNATVNGRNAFGAEWPGVGYFSSHADRLNTFEIVIIDRSDTGAGNFDLEYNYDQIQWEVTDTSLTARAGYSNGSNSSFELPGSGVTNAFLDGGPNSLVANSLNSGGVNGRYVFQARNGAVNNTPGSPVPLPPTIFLVGGGLAAYGLSRIRRRKA